MLMLNLMEPCAMVNGTPMARRTWEGCRDPACDLAARNMDEENTRVKYLRDKVEKEILDRIPNSRLNGETLNRLPNTTNISFEFVEG